LNRWLAIILVALGMEFDGGGTATEFLAQLPAFWFVAVEIALEWAQQHLWAQRNRCWGRPRC